MEDILLLNKFFPIVDRCLSCEDIARETCAMVRRWTENEFCTWQNSDRRQDIPEVYIIMYEARRRPYIAQIGWPPVSDVAAVTLPRLETR